MSVLKKYWSRETKTLQKMSNRQSGYGMKGGDREADRYLCSKVNYINHILRRGRSWEIQEII